MSTIAGDTNEQIWEQRKGNETRVGDWMEMQPSGSKFFPLDPRPEEVNVFDLSHHLARINRYNGGIKLDRYSVCEHVCVMADYFMRVLPDEPAIAYQALHHDDPEAYIGDMVRPLKRNMPNFVEHEDVIWRRAVAPAFQLPGNLHPLVKEADNRILVDEREQVVGRSQNNWGIDHLEPLGVELLGWGPKLAQARYLLLHHELRSKLGL